MGMWVLCFVAWLLKRAWEVLSGESVGDVGRSAARHHSSPLSLVLLTVWTAAQLADCKHSPACASCATNLLPIDNVHRFGQ